MTPTASKIMRQENERILGDHPRIGDAGDSSRQPWFAKARFNRAVSDGEPRSGVSE